MQSEKHSERIELFDEIISMMSDGELAELTHRIAEEIELRLMFHSDESPRQK